MTDVPPSVRPPTVQVVAGAESDGADVAGCDPEAVAEWLQDDPAFIAGLNRAKSFRRERLRADVLSLASDAMATLRELVSGPEVPPSVRLRASLAILEAAGALKTEEIGPTTAEGVQAKIEHKRFIESLGGKSVGPVSIRLDSPSRSRSQRLRTRPSSDSGKAGESAARLPPARGAVDLAWI